MPIKQFSEIQESPYRRFLIQGPPGTGKSVFAATCPSPLFVFDFDNMISIYAQITSDLTYAQFEMSPKGWNDFTLTLDTVLKQQKSSTPPPYKTIIFDSATKLADLALEFALQLDPSRDETEGPVWNIHYKMVKNLVSGKIRQATQFGANANFVLICHTKESKNTDGAIISIDPLLPGDMSTKTPSDFGEVLFSGVAKDKENNTQYYLQTTTVGLRKARSHLRGVYNLLPDRVPNTYPQLMQYYTKAKEAKEAKNTNTPRKDQNND